MYEPDEDAYWERRREEYENPKRDFEEPRFENDTLFLDDVVDDLEQRFGCMMQELGEPDLEDIVQELTGIIPDRARFNERLLGIDYRYDTAI